MSEAERVVTLPVDVFNGVTDYLSQRPYKEVSRMIDEIRQSAKVVEVPQEEEETPND